LLAIGLSVGILVTNSIVVLENIVKRSEERGNAREGARVGAGEVAVAVLASAGTNLVVLLPIAMMGSQVGLFFAPFALTMVIATAVSLFISFTLTPILAAAVLRPGKGTGIAGRLSAISDGVFGWVSNGYLRFLRLVGRKRWVGAPILVVTALLFFQALSLAPKLGFGFFPDSDQGKVYIKLEYPTSYSLERTKARVHEVEELIRDLPNREHTLTTIGKVEGVMGQASEGVYLAQILVKFKNKLERPETIDEIIVAVRKRIQGYPDAIITVSTPEFIGGQSYPIELEIAGSDLRELDRIASGAVALAGRIPGIEDPDSTVRLGKPELRVRPRRAVLSDLGFAPTTMGLALRANLEGITAGSFKRGDRTYDIRVKLAEEKGKDQVEQFLFPGAPGRPMLLSNLASIEEKVSPIQIVRSDKRRISKVFTQLETTTPLGTAVGKLKTLIDSKLSLPAGYSYRFANIYELMQEANTEMAKAGLIAILLTYLVLAAILESFTKPFIILITIPLGLIGILWSLYLTGEMISMFVMLGGVMLIGIVVNNAILIMDKVNQYTIQGLSKHEAMARASAEALRPIIMITMAAMLGMMPLAVSRGIGSEMRNSIGISSVGGIGISAVLTLIVLPVLYDMFTRKSPEERVQAHKKKAPG
jgi:HAE1 family hydrophobic/amphiphilic exporter-1